MPGHECPPHVRAFIKQVDKGVEVIAVAVVVMVAIVWLKDILIAVGALAVGVAVGLWQVRRWVRKHQAAIDRVTGRAQVGQGQSQALAHQQPQQQAVDGGQHVHLHGEAAVRAFLARGERR